MEIVGLLSDAEAMEQARRGHMVRSLSPRDPRVLALQFGRGASSNDPPETVVPIDGADERVVGRVPPPVTRANRNSVGKRTRADPLTDKAIEDEFVSRARSELVSMLPAPSVREFVYFCVEKTRSPLSAAQAADGAGVDYVALAKTLDTAGYPTAEDIVTWCRILRAGWFLTQMPGRSGERIAQALQFDSSRLLRRSIERLTGKVVSLRDARFPYLMSEFVRRLREVNSMQIGSPGSAALR